MVGREMEASIGWLIYDLAEMASGCCAWCLYLAIGLNAN